MYQLFVINNSQGLYSGLINIFNRVFNSYFQVINCFMPTVKLPFV